MKISGIRKPIRRSAMLIGVTACWLCATSAAIADSLPNCDLFQDGAKAQSAYQSTISEHAKWEAPQSTDQVNTCASQMMSSLSSFGLRGSVPSDQGTIPPSAVISAMQKIIEKVCSNYDSYSGGINGQNTTYAGKTIPGYNETFAGSSSNYSSSSSTPANPWPDQQTNTGGEFSKSASQPMSVPQAGTPIEPADIFSNGGGH